MRAGVPVGEASRRSEVCIMSELISWPSLWLWDRAFCVPALTTLEVQLECLLNAVLLR